MKKTIFPHDFVYVFMRIKLSVRIMAGQQSSFFSFYGLIYCLKERVSIVLKTKVRNHRRVANSPSAKFKYLRKCYKLGLCGGECGNNCFSLDTSKRCGVGKFVTRRARSGR